MSEFTLRPDQTGQSRLIRTESITDDRSRDDAGTRHEQIARRAYEIFEGSGCKPGCCSSNWEQAERQVREQAVREQAVREQAVREQTVKVRR